MYLAADLLSVLPPGLTVVLASLLLGAVASTVTAPAASAAAPAGGAPAAPAESPPVDSSQLSDDQLLDAADTEAGEGDSPQPGAPADAGKPAAEAAPAKADGKDVAEELDTTGPVPDDIKALFATPGVGPKVRDMFYQLAAYRQIIPTVAEARKLQELFPEGMTSVEQTMEQLSRFEGFDDNFYRAKEDPQAAATFVDLMHQSDPEHFRAVSNQWAGVWAEVDPEGYSAFHQAMIQNWLDAHYEQAERLGDENWVNSIDTLSRREYRKEYTPPGARNGGRADPREQNLKAREQSIRDREQKAEQQVDLAFRDDCRLANNSAIREIIKAQLDVLPVMAEIQPGGRQRIESDIAAEVEKTLRENAVLTTQLERAVGNGRRDPSHQTQITNLVKARAAQVTPRILAKVVDDWTMAILGRSKQITSQRTEAARAVDLGRGGAPIGDRGKALPSSKQIDYRRTSDDDILEENFVLRK